jgi:hypothetical protein
MEHTMPNVMQLRTHEAKELYISELDNLRLRLMKDGTGGLLKKLTPPDIEYEPEIKVSNSQRLAA